MSRVHFWRDALSLSDAYRCGFSAIALTLGIWHATVDAAEATRSAMPVITAEPRSYHAQSLEMRDVDGRVRIEVEDRPDLQLLVKGPADAVRGVRAEVRDRALSIVGDRSITNRNISVVGIGSATAVVVGEGSASVSIGSVGDKGGTVIRVPERPPLEVTVRMPRGMPLRIGDINGDYRIGDTHAPVHISVARGKVSLGRVGEAELEVHGTGDIDALEIIGKLRISVQGSGDVRVRGGQISQLDVILQGSGDVNVGGHAQRANLTVEGAGDIRVAEVAEKPHIKMSGAGDISVGNW